MSIPNPRVLIFIDWFTPGYKAGGPIQSCANMIAHLKDNFDFWVITRDTDYCETVPYPNIASNIWNKVDEHLQVYYTSTANLNYTSLSNAAKSASPDIIFINGVYSLYFSILPLRIAKKLNCQKVIVSARGMLAPSAIQVKSSKKKLFLNLAQLMGLYKNVLFHATNEAEATHIRNQFGDNHKVKIAPNLPKLRQAKPLQVINKTSNELRLVSIARISPEKNTQYALEILKSFTFNGRIIFDIYGPIYNEAYWGSCQDIIDDFPEGIEVNYKGSLDSELVHATLQKYHALFLPTRGENFGHIILESLSAGVPVLISDQTPWQQLKEKGIGYSLPLLHPNAFADALQDLLNLGQQDFNSLSKAAYLYAQDFIQNKAALEQNRLLFS